MLLAHLRGLLKPDYPQGIRSMIREELVLQAVSQEVEGQGLMTQAQMTSSMMPAIDEKSRPRSLRMAMDNLRMGTALIRMEPYHKLVRQVKSHSLEANVAALKMLAHTDVFAILKANLNAELKK
jgi:hypothetical protein